MFRFRIIVLALLVLVPLFLAQGVYAARPMPVEAYEDALASLRDAGIVDRSGPARLYDSLNRAEALKMVLAHTPDALAAVSAVARAMPPVALFSDIDQTAWYAPYIEVAFSRSIAKGYPDGTFRPGAPLRVAEAVALLMRSDGSASAAVPFRTSEDLPNDPQAWYASAVSALLARNGVMPTSALRAGDTITRGQFMDMIYRVRRSKGQTTTVSVPRVAVQVVPPPTPASSTPTTVSASSASYRSSRPFAISIPSIGLLDLPVSRPKDTSTQKGLLEPLDTGVGHLLGLPGEGGKIMIYGHSSNYPWKISDFSEIFRTINKVAVGERVYVTRDGKLFAYQVTEKRTIPAKDHSVFEPDDDGEELILYTCWPVGSISSRYIVIARPVSEVAER